MKITAKIVRKGFAVALVCFAAIQLIPYGHNRTNPPITKEPAWNSPTTRALAKRACFDCHSHETIWPWYSRVAPVTWLIYSDVQGGRLRVNFSDWQHEPREGETVKKLKKEIISGDMPPFQYLLAHPEARLTPLEKQNLIEGLAATAAARR